MSFPVYHSMALTDPKHGYYMNSNVFNKAGDFVTAPEISTLFGDIVGLWVTHFLETVNVTPQKRKTLIEFGAGTGTLMAGILNILAQFGHLQNLDIIIVEASPFLTKLQQKKINDVFAKRHVYLQMNDQNGKQVLSNKGNKVNVQWYPSWLEFMQAQAKNQPKPEDHYIFVNNEFFDALPVHKFKYTRGKWHELMIDLRVEHKPTIITTSSEERTKGVERPLDPEASNFFQEKTFIETLGPADSEAVNKLLVPAFRFEGAGNIAEGTEYELCALGFFTRNDDRELGRRARFKDERRGADVRLRRAERVHRLAHRALTRASGTTSTSREIRFLNCRGSSI